MTLGKSVTVSISAQMSREMPGGDRVLESGGRAVHVLIVEDEALIAMDYCDTIISHGGSVVGMADTADRALLLAQTTRPDIVLMDIRLNDGNGLNAARAIRSQIGSKILFCSGNGDPQTRRMIAEFGDAGILLKPIGPDQLLQAIAGMCAGLRPEQASGYVIANEREERIPAARWRELIGY